MTDKDKLNAIVKLADAMYYAAQYLTTDASRLHKAMEEYHQFIINEYHKKEPVSENLESAAEKYRRDLHNMEEDVDDEGYMYESVPREAFKAGAEWQKERLLAKACEFFENHLCCYIKAQDFTIEHSRLEQDFKQYMEE